MKSKHHSSDEMFTFLLLLIFCIFTLILAGMGASVYQNSASHLDENYTSRTAVSYVSEKIRQHDIFDSITLTELENIPALCLSQTIEDEPFVTYIYYFDGALRELFIRQSTLPQAASGTSIVELTSFTMEECSSDGTLYKITACSKNGRNASVLIHPSAQ